MKVGFPINAVVSFALAAVLVVVALRVLRLAPPVLAVAVVFEAASLGSLILSRVGNVLGWKETSWTLGAEQARGLLEGGEPMSTEARLDSSGVVKKVKTSVYEVYPSEAPVMYHVSSSPLELEVHFAAGIGAVRGVNRAQRCRARSTNVRP